MLSETDYNILSLLYNNGSVSPSFVSKSLGVSVSTARRHLEFLCDLSYADGHYENKYYYTPSSKLSYLVLDLTNKNKFLSKLIHLGKSLSESDTIISPPTVFPDETLSLLIVNSVKKRKIRENNLIGIGIILNYNHTDADVMMFVDTVKSYFPSVNIIAGTTGEFIATSFSDTSVLYLTNAGNNIFVSLSDKFGNIYSSDKIKALGGRDLYYLTDYELISRGLADAVYNTVILNDVDVLIPDFKGINIGEIESILYEKYGLDRKITVSENISSEKIKIGLQRMITKQWLITLRKTT